MKIIFLDVDGVLVTINRLSDRLKQEKVVNEKCVSNLNHITNETGAKIVISSAWRFNGLNEMRCILNFWGVKGEVIGATPDLCVFHNNVYHPLPRINEIQSFLENTGMKDVESFVILDDLGNSPMSPNHIHTKFRDGLTEENAEAAIGILKSNFWKN